MNSDGNEPLKQFTLGCGGFFTPGDFGIEAGCFPSRSVGELLQAALWSVLYRRSDT